MEALATPKPRNLERFLTATGKTESDYQAWATEVGKRMHINTLDRLICAKLGVYTVAHLVQMPTTLPDGMWDEAQVDLHLVDYSENPLELAKLWLQYQNEARMYLSTDTVLAEYLNPFPKTDFENNGDANWLADVSPKWFKKKGTNLDVQVDEINEVAPIKITMDDVIDYVRTWQPHRYKSPAQVMVERIEERFKELTTFRIKDYYADHLMRSSILTHPASTEETPF